MTAFHGHQATLNGRVGIDRLIGRRARLQKALTHENTDEKRASLQSELDEIETALQAYKAALADL